MGRELVLFINFEFNPPRIIDFQWIALGKHSEALERLHLFQDQHPGQDVFYQTLPKLFHEHKSNE